jgi:hypothetical protein
MFEYWAGCMFTLVRGLHRGLALGRRRRCYDVTYSVTIIKEMHIHLQALACSNRIYFQ